MARVKPSKFKTTNSAIRAVEAYRLANGLSQKKMAHMLGMDEDDATSYVAWVSGRKRLSLDRRIAAYKLGISPHDLLRDD